MASVTSTTTDEGQPGPVFILTPNNRNAMVAFAELATATRQEAAPRKVQHYAKFITIVEIPSETARSDDINGSFTSTGSNGTSPDEGTVFVTTSPISEALPLYIGHYSIDLNIQNRPNTPIIGWIIGTGTGRDILGNNDAAVDIQIAPDVSWDKYEIAGHHAKIVITREGSWMVQRMSNRGRTVVEDMLLDTRTTKRVLDNGVRRLSFGNLDFKLEWKVSDQNQYLRDMRHFVTTVLKGPAPPPDIAATPSLLDVQIGPWSVKGVVGSGSVGQVRAAVHCYSGMAGAAKIMMRDAKTEKSIAHEIQILGLLPKHSRLLCLERVFYSWGEGPEFRPKYDETDRPAERKEAVYVLVSPFATTTLESFIGNNSISRNRGLKILYQVLDGISALHEEGLVHRDIKPANIGILRSIDDLQVVILDYGSCIKAVRCDATPGRVGTIPYLAPEMEQISYTNAVDIWACGVVGLRLFMRRQNRWSQVRDEPEIYNAAMAELGTRNEKNSVEGLLLDLLAWEPMDRPSAQEAKVDNAFANVQVVESIEGRQQTKRKR